MKKTILIVAHHLTIGGVQKSLISTLKALEYDKYDVTLYLRKNRTTLIDYVDKRVNVIINDDKNHYYRKPSTFFYQLLIFICKFLNLKKQEKDFNEKLGHLIQKYSMNYEKKTFFQNKKYDIAVSYVQGYEALFVSDYINADKKYVYFHTSTNDLPNVHKKIIDKFDKVIGLHENQKKLISKWYNIDERRIVLISNYVDTEIIKKQSNEYSVVFVKDYITFCSCGRFSFVKGFDLALKTAKILREKNINFKWYFVGDGPERNNLEKLIDKYNLQNNIVISGMQTNPYPYMACCDIYIQPSYEESQGITMLEALRLNIPVISTATIGGCSVIENGRNGLLSEINEYDLANKISTLIDDKLLYDKITRNLKNIDYTKEFEVFKKQWSNLLEE